MRKTSRGLSGPPPAELRFDHMRAGRGAHIDLGIPFPEIAVELGVPKREILRWARARASGKSFRSSPAYRAYALEVHRRHRLIDYVLFFSDEKYVDGIFENGGRRVA